MKKAIFIFAISACITASAQTYSLQQLKDSALQNNIAMHNAQHDIAAAQQQRKEAFTHFFPNVSAIGVSFNANKGMAETTLNPSEMITPEMGVAISQMFPPEALAALANPMSISMMKNGTIAGVTAVQPVFAGGQIIFGNKLAKVGEEVSILQQQLSENEVEKYTEQYYWQLITLQEKKNTLAAVSNLLNDLHKDAELAVRAGLTLRNDLLQVELRQKEVKSQAMKLDNGISLVRMLLAQYCGLRDTTFTLASPAFDGEKPLPPIPLHISGNVIENLPEYKLLGKQVEAATLQKRIAMGKNLPSVAVGAGYNYHNLMDKDHTFAMFFATVSVPISDWWGGSHAIKRRKIELEKAEEQMANNTELLNIRLQNAWNGVREAYSQLELSYESIAQASESLRLQRDNYRAGTCTMSDLLQAQLTYQQALDNRTEMLAEYQNKSLEYRQAAGE